MSLPAPSAISALTQAQELAPLLHHLLECPTELLPSLSENVCASITDLPSEDRPTTYEGLLDVARFVVEEEPGWSISDRAKLVGGHPRIGRKGNSARSQESEKEQGQSEDDEATLQRLDKLNYLYEQRFPTLRFVTYVAGRSRAQVADELEALLGPNIAGLAPSDAHLDPNDVHSSSASFTFPAEQVIAAETPLWEAELHRGEDALWEIAGDRAGKLVRRIEAGEDVQAHVPASTAAPVAPTAFDVPFLSLPTFRALILSSPLLHTFFESDLPQSFILEPPARQTSTKDAFLSAFNDAANAAQGVGTSTGKPVITRERFKGLFGGLIGEVANRVGQQTISGPKPSFSSRAGGRTLSLEEAAGRGSKLAPVSPAALGGRKPSIAALRVESKEAAKGEKQVQDATEALRLAQEALLQRDTNQFVIDAPGDETADAPGESVEDLDIDLDAEEGSATQSRVTGKEAQIAKDLRTAEAH